jgi:hypothetical protein
MEIIMTVVNELQMAIDNSQILTINYHSGSQPGTIRQISPIEIKNEHLRAKCYLSNKVKLFKIDKIEIVNDSQYLKEKSWDKNFKPSGKYNSLQMLFDENITMFQKLGWHINNSSDEILLHSRFKNGKPKKGSDVAIIYEEFTYDLVYDDSLDDFIEGNKRKRTRPWIVMAKNMETKTFGILDHAVDIFLEKANELAPINYNI